MTANEMADRFETWYDSFASMESPGFNDAEISRFLTKAQDRFIKHHYNPKGNKYREGFDLTEKRKKDLSELLRGPRDQNGSLVTSLSSDQERSLKNGTLFDLPSDVWLVIYEEAAVGVDNCEDATITSPVTGNEEKVAYHDVRPIGYDEYKYFRSNPFRKPTEKNKRVWRLDFSEDPNSNIKTHELVTEENSTIHEYYIRYIRDYNDITVDRDTPNNQQNSELHDRTHPEIVDEAVNLALEASKNERFKTQTAINQQSE